MKKKFTAILLTVIMTVSLFGNAVYGANGADERVQAFVTKLAAQSPSERSSIINAVIPMLITDTGLDALTYYVNSYNPASTSLFDIVVGKLLAFTDKETALNSLGYLRTIDESIREDYLLGFQNRKERTLSDSAQRSLESFVKRQCALYSGLEKILTEDKITTGVIARLFEIPYTMNNSKPILTDGSNGFAINEVDPAFRAAIKAALSKQQDSGFKDENELLAAAVEWINSGFLNESKMLLKSILGDVGVYKALAGNVNGSGGVAATPVPTADEQNRIGYELIESSVELGYDIIEICRYTDGKKEAYGDFGSSQIVSIKVLSPNAMLYKIDREQLVPVKYSTYADGELVCRVESSGRYAVKIMNYYFDDATGWGRDYIEALYNRGVINGKGERAFAPEDNITREEFVKLVVEVADMADENASTDFVDVAAGQWYENYVAVAQTHGFINGVGGGRFGVGSNITRQDMSKILCDMLIKGELLSIIKGDADVFGDAPYIAQYARGAVGVLSANSILSGDENGNFNPENNATRQEAAKLIYKMLELYTRK